MQLSRTSRLVIADTIRDMDLDRVVALLIPYVELADCHE
jgi:hypothetical protein